MEKVHEERHQQGNMNCSVLAHLQLGWEMRSFANNSSCETTWSPQSPWPDWAPGQFCVLGKWHGQSH